MTNGRIYLSGPVTGIEDYEDKFLKAEIAVRRKGYKVINPAPLYKVMPSDATYEEYMRICFDLLDLADYMVLLPGWEKSCGANREYGYALAKDLIILPLEDLIREEGQ